MAASCFASLGLLLLAAVLLALAGAAHGHSPVAGSALSSTFYDESCPGASNIVRRVVQNARVTDPRIPASLIRLHFHDCFVNVSTSATLVIALHHLTCEPSICFRAATARSCWTTTFPRSRARSTSPPTTTRRAASPWSTKSRAPLRTLAAASSPAPISSRSQPKSLSNSIESANNLPSFFDPLDKLQEKFRNFNLDDTDLVALQGAHTFGKVQCQFAMQNCTAGQAEGALENLDQVTPGAFDNKYYGNLLQGRAQLLSDQVMLSGPAAATTTAPIVHRFAGDQRDFFRNFAVSMVKMGNISPLTGSAGEIRKNCRRVNSREY